jgi:hypothetical protein
VSGSLVSGSSRPGHGSFLWTAPYYYRVQCFKWSLSFMANKRRSVYHASMDEGRKRVLLITAAILAARKLSQFPSTPRVPATISAISDAIRFANQIMVEIDRLWPTK